MTNKSNNIDTDSAISMEGVTYSKKVKIEWKN